MSLAVVFAVVDGLVGAYLLWYAARRQRRDRGALAVVAVFLLFAALGLSVVGLLPQPREPRPLPPSAPAGDMV
jgi:predicted PurR-regulated permease PerM